MGHVCVYTGEGKGKTSAALGIALRALGEGKRVVVIQFLKGSKEAGEYMAQRFLPRLEVRQFGTLESGDVKKASPTDMKMAGKGVAFARKALAEAPDVLILDEINAAAGAGMVKVEEVLDLLRAVPEKTEVYLTGAGAPEPLQKRADFVTELVERKSPGKQTR